MIHELFMNYSLQYKARDLANGPFPIALALPKTNKKGVCPPHPPILFSWIIHELFISRFHSQKGFEFEKRGSVKM